jgi:lauroyl/myristoyl acyltransferase
MNARQLLIAALDRSLSHVMAHAPDRVADGLSGFMGRKLGPRLHPRAVANVRAALTRLRPAGPIEALCAANVENSARSIMEVPRLRRIQGQGRIRVEGAEHLAARPLIVAGLHLGNWETLAPAMWQCGAPPTAIYEPPPDAYREMQAVRARTPFCQRLLRGSPTATRTLVRTLEEERGVVLLFIDEVRDGSPNAPAMGRPIAEGGNISTIVRLARRTGAQVVLAHATRHTGPSFDVRFSAPIAMPADLREGIATLDAAAEAAVRPNLGQWLFLSHWR